MTTTQTPLGSGLGATSTAEEALAGRDLSGKVAIVTGGYSGIGLETTRVLAAAGATVIVPVRTPEKARTNLAGLPGVEMAPLDLMEPASIARFAEGFLASGCPLHLLINSAGIMAAPLTREARGFESQFAANHLGHFQLTALLWPALCKAGGARIVALSSAGHRFSGVNFDDPQFVRRAYDKWQAYGQSKTANALFAMGADARGADEGIRAFSVHPGGILTDLVRYLDEEDFRRFGITRHADGRVEMEPGIARVFKTVPQGAATSLWCATSPLLEGKGGVYCENCDIAVPVAEGGDIGSGGVLPWARDPDLAERLWGLSETLTGTRLPA
jgi:NAD(P)-dependent dehydrogenase (short-subunit alcohol dehydrogenase family)